MKPTPPQVDTLCLFGPNPPDITAQAQPDLDRPIVKNGKSYAGIGVTYDNPGDTVAKMVTLTPVTGQKITSISTTTIDKMAVNVPWTSDAAGFHYSIAKELTTSGAHEISFTIIWANGLRHDPKIIINPTIGGPI